MSKEKIMIGYHFTGDTLLDGSPIPKIGEWLVHKGPVKPCESGLHMSEHPFDALQYAPGCMLHKVELTDSLQSHEDPVDKWVGRKRRILASANVEQLCWAFARWNALQVIHLWKAPDIVKRYLETGDETLRAAAWAAAGDAAGAAAWDAAGDAARAAARDAFIIKSRAKFVEMVEETFKGTV